MALTTEGLAKHSAELLRAERARLSDLVQEQSRAEVQFGNQKIERISKLMKSIASAIDPSLTNNEQKTSRDVFSSLAGSLQSHNGISLLAFALFALVHLLNLGVLIALKQRGTLATFRGDNRLSFFLLRVCWKLSFTCRCLLHFFVCCRRSSEFVPATIRSCTTNGARGGNRVRSRCGNWTFIVGQENELPCPKSWIGLRAPRPR